MSEQSSMVVTSGESARHLQVAREVATACKEIVESSHVVIQKRKYVKVEGWQAIANGFGCTAAARDVEKVYDPASGELSGFRAIGEVRRQSDGVVLATGEGFVGADEPVWFGGIGDVFNKRTRKWETKNYKARAEYGVRAMAQTRAISRACRAAFAFIVVMINKDFSTTPAEEVAVDDEPFAERADDPANRGGGEQQAANESGARATTRWQDVVCSFGKAGGPLRDKTLGQLTPANRRWLYDKFVSMEFAKLSEKDKAMTIGLKLWAAETGATSDDQQS